MTPTETLDHIHEIHDLASRAGFELEEGREVQAVARLTRAAYWADEVCSEIQKSWEDKS